MCPSSVLSSHSSQSAPSEPPADAGDEALHCRRWLAAGDLHWQLGEAPAAVDAYRKAVACAPEDPEPWLCLARVYESQGRWAQGDHAYERAQALVMPDDAPHEPTRAEWSRLRRVHQRMARYRLARGDGPGALACLRHALTAARYSGELKDARAEIRFVEAPATPHRPEDYAALFEWLGDDDSLELTPVIDDPDALPDALPKGLVLGGVWVPLR